MQYARWPKGEVDIVNLSGSDIIWAVEVKWSDHYFHYPYDLESLLSVCRHHKVQDALVTTRTCSGTHLIDGVRIDFIPASLYCYTVGYNIVRNKSFDRSPLPDL